MSYASFQSRCERQRCFRVVELAHRLLGDVQRNDFPGYRGNTPAARLGSPLLSEGALSDLVQPHGHPVFDRILNRLLNES